MRYSVIDISSTSISMIVAEARGKEAEIVFKDRANLTILHYLDGRDLSARGIEKVVASVAAMKQKCERLGTDVLLLISTASLRAIGNFEQVGAAVLGGTGIPINPVAGKREAYCDLVANRSYASLDKAAILDIGGASVEVCDINEKGGSMMASLPFGILNLHEKFVSGIQPEEGEAKKIRKFVTRKADKAGLPEKGVFDTVILVGAAALAVYGVYEEYFGAQKGEREMSVKKLKKLTGYLLGGHDRSKIILDAAPDKLYSVGIAAVVARNFVKRFGAERILVSDRGVKEGYLFLTLAGREKGAYYDFNAGKAVFPAPEEQPAAAGKPAREEQPAPAQAQAARSGAAPVRRRRGRSPAEEGEEAPVRRGRRAAAAGGTASKKGVGSPAKAPSAPKRRGRKPAAGAGEAKPAPGRRGRPPKAAAVQTGEEKVAESVQDTTSKE